MTKANSSVLLPLDEIISQAAGVLSHYPAAEGRDVHICCDAGGVSYLGFRELNGQLQFVRILTDRNDTNIELDVRSIFDLSDAQRLLAAQLIPRFIRDVAEAQKKLPDEVAKLMGSIKETLEQL